MQHRCVFDSLNALVLVAVNSLGLMRKTIACGRILRETLGPVDEAFLSSGQGQRHAVHFANNTGSFKADGDDQDRDRTAVSWPR